MSFFRKALDLYVDGFRNMSLTSRKLWLIVLVKFFIMFAVLKVFFFNDTLKSRYETDDERGNHVYKELVEPKL